MTLAIMAISLWLFPYLERFKSPRHFSLEIRKIVGLAAPLYIYADSMHDFNYYMERETMPILATPQAVDALLASGPKGYMLIKERDLKRLASLPPEWIVASDRKGSATWNLVEFRNRVAP